MVDKELADYIKGVVSTYCGISTQAIGVFIYQYLSKMFATQRESPKIKVQKPIEIYNEICKEMGLLKDND